MKKKKLKKKYGRILAILMIILIIAILFFSVVFYTNYYYPSYDFPVIEFVDNQKNEPYSQNIPLHEMDFDCYYQYFTDISSLIFIDSIDIIELPCDIDYYERKEDSVPKLTLKKGTEVYVLFANFPMRSKAGYGMICWSDYEEEWRYGCPFFTEAIPYVASEHPMYYVKSSQLRKVALAYYQANKKWIMQMPWDFIKVTQFIDEDLYRAGAFCPKRWEIWKKQ